jgi:hypothetical protein
MDQETHALRADIAETRQELGDAVQELSARLAPRQQASRLVAERRDLVLERLRGLSGQDLSTVADRIRTAVASKPRAAAGIAGGALLLALRRRRGRR